MTSFLCPTDLDRVRVVEANDGVRRARIVSAVACGLALIAAAPWLGWWTLIFFGLAVVNLATLDRRLARSERPERVAMGSLVFNLGLFAVGIALTGGPESPILPWILIPAATAPTRFRGEVVFVFCALTAVTAFGVTIGVDPNAAAENPVPLLVLLSLLASFAGVTWAMTNAELKHRDAAVLDPLTGLLNRTALKARVAELEQQARLTGDSVCFVACDIDGFKRVNDGHGHARGDAVLRAIAYELRKGLRSFELIYRLGGEEFLVILPGADLAEGVEAGDRLRAMVEDCRPGGLELTMSVGVSAAAGERATYEELFGAADAALYRAKQQGRNRVVASDATAPLPAAQPAFAPAS